MQLPPEADLDAYSAMPVEQFGMALLRCAHACCSLPSCGCVVQARAGGGQQRRVPPPNRLLLLLHACLCRGMGWEEGRAIGRNAKEEVKAKELVR